MSHGQEGLFFGEKTGHVFIRDFDEGLVKTFGAELDPDENQYFIHLPEMDEYRDDVPVILTTAEAGITDYEVPSFVFRREDLDPEYSRHHVDEWEYKIPSDDAQEVEPGVWDEIETKKRAVPYDITYSVEMNSRYQNHANAALQFLMKRFATEGFRHPVFVEDSVGDIRTYEGLVESISQTGELQSVVDREVQFSLSVRIQAELDMHDPETRKAVLRRDIDVKSKKK